MSKEACVVVFDVGQSMAVQDSSGNTRLEHAKKALTLLVQQKLLFGYKQDVLGVVFVNSRKTKNPLNTDEDPDGYQHIAIDWQMQTPSLELLECIDSYGIGGRVDDDDDDEEDTDGDAQMTSDSSSQSHTADLIDSVLVAEKLILTFVRGRKYSKRVFLVTDAGSGEIGDLQQMPDICNSFKTNDISFYCLGIGFGEEEEEEDEDDEDDDDSGEEGKEEKSEPTDENGLPLIKITGGAKNRKPLTLKNEVIMRQFCRLVGEKAAVFSATSAISMMSALRSRGVLQRAMYNGPLELGNDLAMNIQLYSRCREQPMPSLKKASALAEDGMGVVKMDRIYVNQFQSDGNGDTMQDQKDPDTDMSAATGATGFGAADGLDDDLDIGKVDEDLEAVPEEERVRSFVYGKQRIPFTEDDIDQFEYHSGEKHFQILAFIPMNQVERESYMGPALVCIPPQTSKDYNNMMFASLVYACFEKDFGIIARLVARRNASPKLVILEPRIKSSAEFFIVNELPFYEDVRNYPFSSFDANRKYRPTKSQLAAATSLINSLDLMIPDSDSDEDDEQPELTEALKPQEVFNPVLQKFYDSLLCRALDPQSDLQPLPDEVRQYLEPPKKLFDQAGPAIKRFSQAFPTRVIPKKEAKKDRKHWSELNEEIDDILGAALKGGIDMNADPLMDGSNIDDDLAMDISEMLDTDNVTCIGTTDPIGDFNKLMKNKNKAGKFEELCNEMFDIIYRMIEESFRDTVYDKVVQCIVTVRKQAILEEKPLPFNDCLESFKSNIGLVNNDIWSRLVTEKVTLICNDDLEESVPECKVSREECINFLTIDEQMKMEQTSLNDEDDSEEEDLDLS